MVALVSLMAVLTLLMWLLPEAPEVRLLHRWLVDDPLAALARFERHHLFCVVILLGFAVGGAEAMAVFGVLGPEIVSAFALDAAIYLDAVLVTYALSAAAMAKRSAGLARHVAMAAIRRIRPRARRARRQIRRRPPANDAAEDDPLPVLLAA